MMKTLRVKPAARLVSVSSPCVILCLLLAACASQQVKEGGAAQAGGATRQANAAPAAPSPASQPAANTNAKTYRGSLNDRGLEMRLTREGERVSGYYEYDGITHGLRLEGRVVPGGKYEFVEKDDAGGQTGKWSCEGENLGEWDQDFTCKWTKPDGSGALFVALSEQAAARPGIAPKVVENRRAGVRVSYPQLVASGSVPLSAAATHFNQLMERKVGKEARDFAEGMEGEKNLYFHAGYNVLLATDELVSVEIAYDSYAGGAHPNSSYEGVTYDLRADRELKLEDVFKPGTAYAKAVAAHCDKDIRRRAGVLEAEAAKEEHRKAGPQEEPPVLPELLEEISSFALTPKGLMIYYDLPHVVAVFDRNFVPYSVVDDYLKPDGPAARLAR